MNDVAESVRAKPIIVRPRDAASLILLRGHDRDLELLAGRRPGHVRFMPGVWVFPGGAIDPEDKKPWQVETGGAHLPPRLVCCARAALRETWEEVGVLVGRAAPADRAAPPASHRLTAIEAAYDERRVDAAIDVLTYVGRAITPTPVFRRFNTRFFVADGNAVFGDPVSTDELEDVGWHPIRRQKLSPFRDVTEFMLSRAIALREGTASPEAPLMCTVRNKRRILVCREATVDLNEPAMRVLVTGASGLIGGAVVARLLAAGHQVTGVARDPARCARSVPGAQWVALDIAAATRPEDWLPCLAGIHSVVNCAGVLQDSPRDSTRGVHVVGSGALFAACERAGVRRIVQISAIGVDRGGASAFSATKREGDAALMQRDLDWVILRPSVVLGPAAYGGSALFRGFAALPILPVVPDTGALQVVQIEDVAATVEFCLMPDAPARVAIDLAGPERLTVTDIVRRYRAWLGWPEPRLVTVPAWLAGLAYRLGDGAGRLGWRPPLRTTARQELRRGAVGDPAPWTALTGIVPQSLGAALMRRPASVQERWFAALYLLKPVVFAVLALFWIATGLVSLGPGYVIGLELMQEAGGGALSGPAVIVGGLLDIAVGAALAFRRTARRGLWTALAVSALYLTAGALLAPGLWAEPLGPLLKILPILVLNLVALAILEDR